MNIKKTVCVIYKHFDMGHVIYFVNPKIIGNGYIKLRLQGLCDRSSRKTNSWTKCLVNAYLRVF